MPAPLIRRARPASLLYARELLSDGAGAIGYLLKDRVSNVRSFGNRRVPAVVTVLAFLDAP